jgi:hypothetical protein
VGEGRVEKTAFDASCFTDFVSNMLEVEIRDPVVKHYVSVGQLKKWLNATVSDPRERTRRDTLKEMVG